MQAAPLNAVVAYIQPFQLAAVVDALRELPSFPGLSVSEVRGFGASKAHPPRPHESTEVVPFETRTRIDVFCRGAQLIAIVETIRRVARTGHPGDGIIFVSPVTLAYRIQTGEWGESAMQPRPGAGRE